MDRNASSRSVCNSRNCVTRIPAPTSRANSPPNSSSVPWNGNRTTASAAEPVGSTPSGKARRSSAIAISIWPAAANCASIVRRWLTVRVIRSNGPKARNRPRMRIATRSQIRDSSGRMWLVTISVLPAWARRRSVWRISIRACGSRPLAGSSRNSTCGSCNSVRAMPIRCFIPKLRLST